MEDVQVNIKTPRQQSREIRGKIGKTLPLDTKEPNNKTEDSSTMDIVATPKSSRIPRRVRKRKSIGQNVFESDASSSGTGNKEEGNKEEGNLSNTVQTSSIASTAVSPVARILNCLKMHASRTENDSLPITSSQTETTDSDNRVEEAQVLSLPTLEELKEKNVEKLLHFFKATWTTRNEADDPGFQKTFLPSVSDFEAHFRQEMSSAECGLIRKMRLSNVTSDTIRRVAASAVYFLVFAKTDRLFSKLSDRQVFCGNLQKTMLSTTVEEKCELISRFICWYDSIPPLRTSSRKLMASHLIEARAQTKEGTTLRTVCRGLLGYWTYCGIIQPSCSKSPTDESRRYWSAIETTLVNCNLRKGGCIELSPASISLSDLKCLMGKAEPLQSLFQLQSILLAVVLAGTGLRIGSIRCQWPKGFFEKKTNVEHKKHFDVTEDESEEETGDSDDTTMDVSFDSLKANDVTVYRLPSDPLDPSDTVRLRVELLVYSSKTTGLRKFAPQRNGFSHPVQLASGCLDWGISVAIALTMLSVMSGATSWQDVVSHDGENLERKISTKVADDIPLIRMGDQHNKLLHKSLRCPKSSLSVVADCLNIPASLFPSRAYRCGFAKSVVEGIVARGDVNRIVPLDEIRSALLTSSRWRSNQVDRYLTNLTKSVLIHSTSDVGITASDWSKAIFQASASKKTSYNHLKIDDLYDYLKERSENENSFREEWKNMKKSERRSVLDAINQDNWIACNCDAMNQPDTQVLTIDVSRTMDDLHKCSLKDFSMLPFIGFGRCQKRGPFKCPVIDCNVSADYSTVQLTIKHWMMYHEKSKCRETYLCAVCPEAGISKYRYYLRHLNKNHPLRNIQFQWSFVSEEETDPSVVRNVVA